MNKRYYWEITDGNRGAILTATPLWRRGRVGRIFLCDLNVQPLPRPYRVSYTHARICDARRAPQTYNRRAYRCKTTCE